MTEPRSKKPITLMKIRKFKSTTGNKRFSCRITKDYNSLLKARGMLKTKQLRRVENINKRINKEYIRQIETRRKQRL